MSVEWTKEQQQVISLQGRNLLVSAAAGSGKTAVLVERIITMLTRAEDPVSVDELLIVTFTEAAAAEMKERIRSAIEKKAEQYPENTHLRQQATLIHSASIMTIHSFCLSVIRENFHVIGLDPSFRIGEEAELQLLKKDVLQELLENQYAESRERFLQFVESYASGKSDRKIEEIILRLYEFSRSFPDPSGWLQDCASVYKICTDEELEATSYFAFIREEVRHVVETADIRREEAEKLCEEPDGPYMYEEMLRCDRIIVDRFRQASTYAEYCQAAGSISWKKLAANKDRNVSKVKAEQVKKLREEWKKDFAFLTEQYFAETPEALRESLQACAPMMEELSMLTQEFARLYGEKKRSRNLIDYGDMEHFALSILTKKRENRLEPSAYAEPYQRQFREIMIDEYQDSNLIQEAVLTSVSRTGRGRNNVFMVGDVKQSIYRFRLSKPELFMEKYHTYRIYEGEGSESSRQRIDLFKNFRSREEVLESVNFLFRKIMMPDLGGITYDERAALHLGAAYPESPGNETELLLVEGAPDPEVEKTAGEKLSAKKLEARAVAARIRKLLQEQLVTDRETGRLRPVRYGDIVILLRSLKGWSDEFLETLQEEGIPASAGSREGYFETREIGVLLDYFRVLENERQDIPLAAVLSSWFGKLSDEELACIRISDPSVPFHEAVRQYRETGEDPVLRSKLSVCLDRMERYRQKVSYTAIHEILWEILDDTGYGSYIAALPRGAQRKANVDMLAQKAVDFENTSYKGLYNFIRYIEQLQKYQVDYGEASVNEEQKDAVRIMSIHKSKGLEFPVVIAAGMGKIFNTQDIKGDVLISASMGIGLEAVDLQQRTKSPSLYKRVIQRKEKLENLSEELRVLYVALTRAKEKLILTGSVKKIGEKMEKLTGPGKDGKPLSFGEAASASSYLDWILPALLKEEGEVPFHIQIIEAPDLVAEEIREEAEGVFTKQALENLDIQQVFDRTMEEHLARQFGFQYPYSDLEGRKQKFTVSELKKREYLKDLSREDPQETGEEWFAEPDVIPLVPRFRMEEEKMTGASRGSAYHRVMELLDFTKAYNEEEVEKAVLRMQEEGRLKEEMAAVVCREDILRFVMCQTGRRMASAAADERLFREQPFVIGVDMKEVYPDCEEQELILVQGIIDACFEEEDGLVVLDYKTDQVREASELVQKYHAQLDYYARALEQILDRPVKEKIIYSFTLGKEIRLS